MEFWNKYKIGDRVITRRAVPNKGKMFGKVVAYVIKAKTKKAGQQMLWVKGNDFDKMFYSSQVVHDE